MEKVIVVVVVVVVVVVARVAGDVVFGVVDVVPVPHWRC